MLPCTQAWEDQRLGSQLEQWLNSWGTSLEKNCLQLHNDHEMSMDKTWSMANIKQTKELMLHYLWHHGIRWKWCASTVECVAVWSRFSVTNNGACRFDLATSWVLPWPEYRKLKPSSITKICASIGHCLLFKTESREAVSALHHWRMLFNEYGGVTASIDSSLEGNVSFSKIFKILLQSTAVKPLWGHCCCVNSL